MTKLNLLPKIFKTISAKLTILGILCLSFVLYIFPSVELQAASTGFSDGNISFSKYYVDNLTELKSITTAPGDVITVRLRYHNTSSSSATGVSISDALPDNNFNYISGTLKNCLINTTNCQTLNDSLFSGQTLEVNPAAGYFGYPTNSASGNLELGRKLYVHQTTCNQNNNTRESFIQQIDNTSIYLPNCDSAGGGSVLNYTSQSLLANRYLHQTTCIQTGGQKEIFVQSINNSPTFTPDCGILGNSVDSSQSLDILANRYLHQTTCIQTGGQKEIFVQSINNSPSFTPDCSVFAGSTVDTTQTIDLFFAANASGYIEYQMESQIVEDSNAIENIDLGNYGFSPSISSNNFTTFSDPMENSISIKIFCDTISPAGATRNLTLSDAELRAGQDFRCNYQASICPIVFDDLNSNGLFDGGEIRTTGIEILLQSLDGVTTIDSLTSTNSQDCFTNLAHGRTYRMTIQSPPSGNSTTGGNTKTQLINYTDTEIEALFGYSNGILVLNVPASVALPSITVATSETFTTTTISPIQVIDTRLSNPGWTLTATVDDFVARGQNTLIIPVSGAFRNTPGSVQINTGQTNGISIGDQKTINSTTDPMSIFSGSSGFSQGDYQINTGIRLTVPAFVLVANYETQYTYTII